MDVLEETDILLPVPRFEPRTLLLVVHLLYGLHYPSSYDGHGPWNVPASGVMTIYHTISSSTPPILLSSHGTMFIRFRCHNLHKSGESTGSAGGNTLLPPQTIFPKDSSCYTSYWVFKPKTLCLKRPSRVPNFWVVVSAPAAVFVVSLIRYYKG